MFGLHNQVVVVDSTDSVDFVDSVDSTDFVDSVDILVEVHSPDVPVCYLLVLVRVRRHKLVVGHSG